MGKAPGTKSCPCFHQFPAISDAYPRRLLLFPTRGMRMFAYGFLSVVLVLYLKAEGLAEQQIGILLTMTLLGDMVISLWITTAADRIGRKRMLILGAGLMILVGCVFAVTGNFLVLLFVATIGVLSPSDKEVGPFLSIEQAALAQTIPDDKRTSVFAWYNLVGSLTAAFGALAGGLAAHQFLQYRHDRRQRLSTAYRGVRRRRDPAGNRFHPVERCRGIPAPR